MDWPSKTDFREAVQFPDKAFRRRDLRSYLPERNRMGVVRTRAGAFAVVYKLVHPTTRKAVAARVFQHPNDERQERYRLINEHIRTRRPSCLVAYEYDPRGVRVNGHEFPLLVMEWAEGATLGAWARAAVARRDPKALRAMADRWVDLMAELRACAIAHGDLQHGNIMVVREHGKDVLKLVDYDCMCVPRLVGKPAFEEGLPAYQHPARAGQPLSLDLDRYSAWVVLTALRALAADLTLWKEFVDDIDNENLCFHENDLADPHGSKLWKRLLASPDREVRDYARLLLDALGKPFDRVPPFELNVLKKLEEACAARPPDWDVIVREADSPLLPKAPLPAHLHKRVAEARTRVDLRDKVHEAVDAARDPRRTKSLLDAAPDLFKDWPAQIALARRARDLAALVGPLDQGSALIGTPGIVAFWDQHAAALKDVPAADPLRREAESWKARKHAYDAFLAALPTEDEERTAQSWTSLKSLGKYPGLTSREEERGELALRRAPLLKRLAALAVDATETVDRQWLGAWNESVLNGCRGADRHRGRHKQAMEGLARLKALETVIADADAGRADQRDVLAAARALPKAYAPRLAARLASAEQAVEDDRKRLDAIQDLERALLGASDLAIAEAHDRARRLGADLDRHPRKADIDLAVRARDKCRALKAIAANPRIDEQDLLWKRLWDEALLGGRSDAMPLRPRWVLAIERLREMDEAAVAYQRRDLPRIKAFLAAPRLRGYPPFEALRPLCESLIQANAKVADLINALNQHDDDQVLKYLNDSPFLAQNQDALQPYQARLEDWALSTLPRSSARNGEPRLEGGQVRVKWSWPPSRLVQEYRVVPDARAFNEDPEFARRRGMKASRPDYERNAGWTVPVFPNQDRLFITIWPVVVFPWKSLLGPPQRIGPIRVGVGGGAPAHGPGGRTRSPGPRDETRFG